MKIPLSLIKSFIEIDLPVAKISETLTLLGIEVDKVLNEQPSFARVVVAEVVEARRHPNSEKLQIAQVNDGIETHTVVCGASNCRAGMKTAFAKIGAILTDSDGLQRRIEKTTIRGIESTGMLCAASELRIAEPTPEEGILELPSDIETGRDLVSLLWDPVFEISLTPNLGHCMSALGIARELSAALQQPIHQTKPQYTENSKSLFENKIKISIEEKHLYRNCLKNRDYAKEAPQNFDSERATIAEWQGVSENRNCEVKPTPAETDSSGYFGISPEKVSEALGHMIGENLHQLGLKIDLQAVVKGMQDEAEGKASPLNEDQCLQAISALQEESFAALAEKNLQEAAEFLKKNKNEAGITSIEEGQIQYRVLKEGEGESVQSYNAPLVRYSGRYLNGQTFAETQDEVISLEDAIPGFSKGVIGMKKGETRILYIHPDQGYGKQNGNSLLIFEVEVVKTDALSEARAASNDELRPIQQDKSLSAQ